MGPDDAVDESKLTLCCAVCCANCSTGPFCGCSGKTGVCCLNCEMCCTPGAPCLPCGCFGPTCDGEGCCNAQAQICCVVLSAAFPCTDSVPIAVTVAGVTLYPKVGCCVPLKEIMER
eukprot:CAMPEP_0113563728 /NCGR_PEP_ID=MMETSP0015_2-20120614/21226_1 /TAXON_ID=2838 /ORGANISM="Odontella" /LENGTH=116 /DNA_ID=CAMNT_0000465733 /DNA_START=135 /DNA_END=485 /DNA_ORIENTATION=- /assembly_acc=CAM_ASM_000160